MALALSALVLLLCAPGVAAVEAEARRMGEVQRWMRAQEFESLLGSAQADLQLDSSSLAEMDAEMQQQAELETGVEALVAQAARNRAKFEAQFRQAQQQQMQKPEADAMGMDMGMGMPEGPTDEATHMDPMEGKPIDAASDSADADAEALAAAAENGEGANGPSAANSTAADANATKPLLPWDDVRLRLRKHRKEIMEAEGSMAKQTEEMRSHLKEFPVPSLRGEFSSGENYWNRGIAALKRSDGVVVGDAASELQRSDARCVICQFVVQQTIGLLTGRPLTSGGATSGGKRAAGIAGTPAESFPGATVVGEQHLFDTQMPPPGMFVELDNSLAELEAQAEREGQADEFAFLEMEASLELMAGSGLSAVLAAEMESTVALNAAVSTFLSAADAAVQHSASQAVRLHYPRSRAARQPHSAPSGGLRNLPPVSYPRQLNDWGFETTRRNRRSDALLHRPRQARYSREDIAAAKARWDAVHEKYDRLYSGVYSAFEKLCSRRMPLAYVGYCQSMARDYRYVAQGLAYGDRAQSICMNANWCDQDSYVRHAVHTYFVREAGDH